MTFPFTTRRDNPAPASRPTRFRATANVKLTAAGYGYCTVFCPSGVRWSIQLVSVSTSVPVSSNVVQPVCAIYEDTQPRTNTYVESTYNGDRNSSNSTYELIGGEAITAEWRSYPGDTAHNGAIATLTVRGIQQQV